MAGHSAIGATILGVAVSKFVIANPFGPFEEPRFGAYLVNTWRKGEVAEVRTPRYLRDNIHVDLLALAYAKFVRRRSRRRRPAGGSVPAATWRPRAHSPSGWRRELAPRLGLEARVRLLTQTDFPSRWRD